MMTPRRIGTLLLVVLAVAAPVAADPVFVSGGSIGQFTLNSTPNAGTPHATISFNNVQVTSLNFFTPVALNASLGTMTLDGVTPGLPGMGSSMYGFNPSTIGGGLTMSSGPGSASFDLQMIGASTDGTQPNSLFIVGTTQLINNDSDLELTSPDPNSNEGFLWLQLLSDDPSVNLDDILVNGGTVTGTGGWVQFMTPIYMFDMNPVPEPTTLVLWTILFGAGLFLLRGRLHSLDC